MSAPSTKKWEHGGSTPNGEAWVWEADAKLLYSGGEDGPPEYEDTRLFCCAAPLAEQIVREHNVHAELLAACRAAHDRLCVSGSARASGLVAQLEAAIKKAEAS